MQGSTDLFQETIEPINVVMKVLAIPVVDRLVVAKVGRAGNSLANRPDVMQRAFQMGHHLVKHV